ncbi:hypothetical protein SEA_LIFES_6 [Microbacterium phage Lifes]|nr:hypothetical protein SEA_LIFES_6 [Microbacterium phage Lifes]
MTEMTREEIMSHLKDLRQRRLDAFRGGSGKGLTSKEHLAMIPEVTYPEDIDVLHAARKTLSEDDQFILDLYSDVWREWGKYRCSVCGRTPAQSAAINYDCAYEC